MNYKDKYKEIVKSLAPHVTKPELEAWVLLEHATGLSREELIKAGSGDVCGEASRKLDKAIEKRCEGVPIPYIVGAKEFFGRDFIVTSDVLIPRPESEELIELVLNYCQKSVTDVLDIGTGSGNIGVTLAIECSHLHIDASDISKEALAVAKKNAKKHKVADRLNFFYSDLFENIEKKYDLIVANLPYVPKRYGADKSTFSEPEVAIFGGEEGTDIIYRFLDKVKHYIKSDGIIVMEIDHRIAEKVASYAQGKMSEKKVETIKDLAGKERFVLVK